MRSEASLARLAEMGIDVYVPRPPYGTMTLAHSSSVPLPGRPSIAIVAAAVTPGELRLLTDIRRALVFAHLEVRSGDATATGSSDAACPRLADACIVFATADRAAGSGRAATHESPLASLLADAAGKRRLWRALRGRIRMLHAAPDRAVESSDESR